jgi:hypothetical protein
MPTNVQEKANTCLISCMDPARLQNLKARADAHVAQVMN